MSRYSTKKVSKSASHGIRYGGATAAKSRVEIMRDEACLCLKSIRDEKNVCKGQDCAKHTAVDTP